MEFASEEYQVTMDAVNAALMGGGGRSAKFEAVGDTVVGIVQHVEIRQQTDIKTGDPLVWPDGNPRNQLVIQLQTEERDPEDDADDGARNLYVPIPSAMRTAIADAIRRAGAKGVESGMKFGVKFTGTTPPKVKGFNPQKLYTVKVELPVQGVSLDEMGEPEDEDSLPF